MGACFNCSLAGQCYGCNLHYMDSARSSFVATQTAWKCPGEERARAALP